MDRQPGREPRPRTTEVIHSPNFTILVNPLVSNRQDIRQLVEEVKNGIPSSWIALEDPRWIRSVAKKVEPVYGQWQDSAKNPRFFAKSRSMGSPAWVKHAKEIAERQLSKFGFSRRESYAFASLVNEINLTPKIKAILASGKAKELAAKYSIEEITFVEPLIGLTNKATGQKIMIYDFIEGHNFSATNEVSPTDFPLDKRRQFVFDLTDLFQENGINPGDIDREQFMFGKTNPRRLYLIDIEGYHTTPPHHSE